jgi:hypothetical protein
MPELGSPLHSSIFSSGSCRLAGPRLWYADQRNQQILWEQSVSILLVLVMFILPYAFSSYRKREGSPFAPARADFRVPFDESRLSIVTTNETAASAL